MQEEWCTHSVLPFISPLPVRVLHEVEHFQRAELVLTISVAPAASLRRQQSEQGPGC